MRDQLFGAGYGAALIGAAMTFMRKGGWAKLVSIFKRVAGTTEKAPDIAHTVAEAFTEQYETLVTEVRALREQVGHLDAELAGARREIEDLRDALKDAHREIERLTGLLIQR
jgi:chromosome segregation ATPase